MSSDKCKITLGKYNSYLSHNIGFIKTNNQNDMTSNGLLIITTVGFNIILSVIIQFTDLHNKHLNLVNKSCKMSIWNFYRLLIFLIILATRLGTLINISFSPKLLKVQCVKIDQF